MRMHGKLIPSAMCEDSVMRLEAYATLGANLAVDRQTPTANCEDCGDIIPIELSKCSNCVEVS